MCELLLWPGYAGTSFPTPTHNNYNGRNYNFCDARRRTFSVIEVRFKCLSRRLQAFHIFAHTEGTRASHIRVVTGRHIERPFVQRARRCNPAAIAVALRGLAGAVKAKFAQNIARRGVVGEVARNQFLVADRFGYLNDGAAGFCGEAQSPIWPADPVAQFGFAI